ncbi:MAG: ABC transporter ATP-binding protein [Saprospiraceae bacterium]|nr:ABC transporter ATP-binding protein [Saprospiraceae bacterium]
MIDTRIRITDIRKRYPKAYRESLCGLGFEIQTGEKFGILGPNGAGKTTLISILCGILQPSSGGVQYLDRGVPVQFREIRKELGFVPQDYAYFEELTPVQNLEYFGALYNLNKKEIRKNTEYLLEVLNLSNVARKPVHTFSGGMKRRVNLAIGIIHQPTILFLDEPTVGIDVQSKLAIIRFLNELNTSGTTIIYTSHHLSEAEQFCDRIVLVDQGKKIAMGPTKALLQQHKLKDLQDLFIQFTGEGYRD